MCLLMVTSNESIQRGTGFQLAHKGTDGVIKVMFAIGDEDWDKHNDTRIPAASG